MKLLVIWLLGVPLAVAGMCAAAALWPHQASAGHSPQGHVTASVSRSAGKSNLKHVVPAVGQ